jgi:hypothetical protein
LRRRNRSGSELSSGPLEVVRDRWETRFVDKGFQTKPDEWMINGSRRSGVWSGVQRSLSHVWSAGPGQFLIQDLTGFEIIDPGCERVALDPTTTGFDYDVDIPTPRGRTVSVEHCDGEFGVEAPETVEVDATAAVSVENEMEG